MTEELTIITERVDDTPLLLAYMERMGLPSLLDEYLPIGWPTSFRRATTG